MNSLAQRYFSSATSSLLLSLAIILHFHYSVFNLAFLLGSLLGFPSLCLSVRACYFIL